MSITPNQPQTTKRMSRREMRAALSLSSIYSLRMLGLFMILPVFALYAEQLHGVTPLLAGLAIGVYGFTQAGLQIPFGLLSDRFGRKPIIFLGLLLFALGSVVAASAETIWGVILGRALQGSGAIAAAVMALAADLTREEQRSKTMALIGISIGFSFTLALMLGPIFGRWIGVDGIFWMTAVLALVGIGVLFFWVPQPPTQAHHPEAEAAPFRLKEVFLDRQLLRLDFGIFALHLMLMANFVVLPLILRDRLGLAADTHWQIYLPVLLFSVLAMTPLLRLPETRCRISTRFLICVAALFLAQLGLYVFADYLVGLALALLVFFTAFNFLEASLPALISRMAPADHRGTAMGLYSSSQFLGAFVGGILGGWIHGWIGASSVFLLAAGCAFIWLLVATGMTDPRSLSNKLLPVGIKGEQEARLMEARLTRIRGVVEAVVHVEDAVAYLKVDCRTLDREALAELSSANA